MRTLYALLTTILLLAFGAAAHAHQVTLDFENLSNPSPGNANNGQGNSYGVMVTQNGFTATNASGYTLNSIAPNPTNGFNYTGSVALFNNFVDGVTTLTTSDGRPFTLNRIDTANSILQTAASGPFGITVTFTGTQQGGGTVTQVYTHGNNNNLETVQFGPDFTNLLAVRFDMQFAFFLQFDNIVVTAVPAVLEPGNVALLMGSAVGGIFALRRHKRS